MAVSASAATPTPATDEAGDDWWKADLELSIGAFYASELDTGRRACQRLLSGRPLPDPVRLAAQRNQTWYAPLLADWIDGVAFAQLAVPVREGWSTFNPSVAANGDALSAIVRSANYRLQDDGRYELLHPDGVIRTENYLVSLDAELRVLGARSVTELAGRASLVSGFPVRGYEDCRLFSFHGSWHLLATVRDRDEEGWCRMVLLDLDEAVVVRETLLKSPHQRRHEKNWVPFLRKDRTCLVYSWEPTVVLALDPVSGRWEELSRSSPSGLTADLRGGTPGVAVDDGWVFIAHECISMPEWRRRYQHRFVLLGEDLTVRAVSRPFFFLERTVEFAAGLAADGGDLVVSFGHMDTNAWCARIPLAAVLERLERDRSFASAD